MYRQTIGFSICGIMVSFSQNTIRFGSLREITTGKVCTQGLQWQPHVKAFQVTKGLEFI